MINIVTYDGKILVKNGLIAANTNCCCGEEGCGCKAGTLATAQINYTSASGGLCYADVWGCSGRVCDAHPRKMNERGYYANYFVNSNIDVAFQELANWIETLGYCVSVVCPCVNVGPFPTGIPDGSVDGVYWPPGDVDPHNFDPDPNYSRLDPYWASAWPCTGSGVVTEDNLAYYQQLYPDINIGDCYLFREGIYDAGSATPENPVYETISYCDNPEVSPQPCAHCCDIFSEPYCKITANCCNDCGALGQTVCFTGTVPIYLPTFDYGGIISPQPITQGFAVTANFYGNDIPCESGCVCPTSGSFEMGNLYFVIDYEPTESPDYKLLKAQAKLCRNNSCNIGPSGAEELNVPAGSCSYLFNTQTECECRVKNKRLCCILHTRDVKGSLNGQWAADKIGGVKVNLDTDSTINSCPSGGIYEDLTPPGYGSGNYDVRVWDCAYQHEHVACGFEPELLPGWQNIGGSYVYTGVGVGLNTVYTLGRSDAGNRKYTWAGGIDSESFNMETSESAPGDAFYCKWKSKEWYYEWRWVELANTYSCGGNADLSLGFPGVGGDWFCGSGNLECPQIGAVAGDPSQYSPNSNEISLTNSTELECGPQWGTWQDTTCNELYTCESQLP